MLSYCKNKEDLALWELSEGIPKTIIDIGASDGITNSNSRMFIENGWRGILIEPQFDKYSELVNNSLPCRLNDVWLLNEAIAQHNGKTPFLYNRVVNDHSRIQNDNYYSDRFGSTPVEEIEIDCRTIKQLFSDFKTFNDLGILSIDTEGFDEYILKDLIEKTNVRPKLIICEHHTKETRNRQREILSEYEQVKKISANIIYKLKQTN